MEFLSESESLWSFPASRFLRIDPPGTLGSRATGAANGCASKWIDELDMGGRVVAFGSNVEGAGCGGDHNKGLVAPVSIFSTNGPRATV